MSRLLALHARLVRPLAVRIGASPRMPAHLPTIVRVDEAIQRLTGGRLTLLDLAGLPSVVVTVPGRRSGVLRSTPLLAVPHEGGWLVAGSYFGGPSVPAWALNLAAAGRAEVRARGRDHTVDVHEATGAERDRLYALMTQTWPNFARYQERTDRTIRVFHLVPVPSPRRGGE